MSRLRSRAGMHASTWTGWDFAVQVAHVGHSSISDQTPEISGSNAGPRIPRVASHQRCDELTTLSRGRQRHELSYIAPGDIVLPRHVFKTRTFARWSRKAGLPDRTLCAAVAEIAAGLVDADLGGNVYKKRVPVPGRGKSGGARVLVARDGASGG